MTVVMNMSEQELMGISKFRGDWQKFLEENRELGLENLIELLMRKEMRKEQGRFDDKPEYIKNKCTAYAEKLDLDPVDVFLWFEHDRSYWAANYYQQCKQPDLSNIALYETLDDFKKNYAEDQKYLCPRCGYPSTNPQRCNSGVDIGTPKLGQEGVAKPCDWASFGFFGCLGKGETFLVRQEILETKEFRIHTWFPRLPEDWNPPPERVWVVLKAWKVGLIKDWWEEIEMNCSDMVYNEDQYTVVHSPSRSGAKYLEWLEWKWEYGWEQMPIMAMRALRHPEADVLLDEEDFLRRYPKVKTYQVYERKTHVQSKKTREEALNEK